jgi:DNA-binding CsgD family transcriptional regulator
VAPLSLDGGSRHDPVGWLCAGRGRPSRAISSAGERFVHTEEVTGSIPVSPTVFLQVRGPKFDQPGRSCNIRASVCAVSTLTDRELTVLDLMAQGLTNTDIAKRLQLSERTVEAHIRHLLLKLDIPDTDDGHRRVLAVLVHLGTRANRTADT